MEAVIGQFPHVFFMAIWHWIFCLAFLLSKERRGAHDLIASIWLLVILWTAVRRSFIIAGLADGWIFRLVGMPMAHGPCLYLYTRILSQPERSIGWRDLIHALPFFALSIVTFSWNADFSQAMIDVPHTDEERLIFVLLGVAAGISVAGYSFASLRLIRMHGRRITEYFSRITYTRSLVWLNAVCGLFLAFLIAYTILQAAASGPAPTWVANAALMGYMLLVSFFCLRQLPVYSAKEEQEPIVDPNVSEAKPKYERSSLSPERMQELAGELIRHMEESKPYLNEDLSLATLAENLGVTAAHVSQVLNMQLGKSFYNFVNEYRVSEVERRLRDQRYAEYPVMRIALESGFSSKSTFHSLFRKMTGKSPGELRSTASP